MVEYSQYIREFLLLWILWREDNEKIQLLLLYLHRILTYPLTRYPMNKNLSIVHIFLIKYPLIMGRSPGMGGPDDPWDHAHLWPWRLQRGAADPEDRLWG